MKFIPVLYQTEMVQALLTKRKTKTRRTKGLENVKEIAPNPNAPNWWMDQDGNAIKCPYGIPGDVLWVRESFKIKFASDGFTRIGYDYKADGNIILKFGTPIWRPSLFMPKEACRIFLKVTKVRVERLQDISQADAKNEGIAHVIDKITGYCGYDYINGGYNIMTTPYNGFRSLWMKINGKDSWDKNPFVWVIEFEQIEKPLNFLL